MSSVTLSRPGIDCINVEISQTGNSVTNCEFKQPILLDKKYVVGVTSLNCPLMNTRMIPAVLPGLIFIRRRNRGNDIRDDAQTFLDGRGLVVGERLDSLVDPANPLSAAVAGSTLEQFYSGNPNLDPAIFTTNRAPVLNISDFLKLLNGFAATFTNRIHAVGINPKFYGGPNAGGDPGLARGFARSDSNLDPNDVNDALVIAQNFANGIDQPADTPPPMFNFGVTPSGFIVLSISVAFANHFYLDLGNAAQTLLGIPHKTIAITQDQVNPAIEYYGVGLTPVGGYVIQPANVSVRVAIYGERSLLQTLEMRQSIHVESNLPIMKTVTVENGTESSNFDLASFTLENESSSRLWFEGGLIQNDMNFITDTHCGQKVLQSRNRPVTQWSPLLHSDQLMSMQLRLYMRVREYDAVTNTWKINKVAFPVGDDTWRCGLRFVSQE